jgi:hypothetical protein
MDLGARTYVCGVSFIVSNVCLSSRRWFMLFLVYESCLVLVLVPGEEIGTSSTDSGQLTRFHLKTETEASPRNVVL